MVTLSEFITSLYYDIHILPDPLYKKIEHYDIKINILEEIFNTNQNWISDQFIKKYPTYKFKFKDQYDFLRRILAREKEYLDKYSRLKNIVVHIYISKSVIIKLIQYFDWLLKQFKNYQQNSIPYFLHYCKIQKTLETIRMLIEKYNNYMENCINNLSNAQGIWFIDLPTPKDIVDLVSDAMLELKNGKLSIPLIRSYIEINVFIILENTINNFLSQSRSKNYRDKKILFTRIMKFADLIDLIKKFDIYNEKDIDILSRIQDLMSKSLHIGTFFDQLTALYIMSYLSGLTSKNACKPKFLISTINEYVKKKKFKVVEKDDNIQDYSRFQPLSNQRG